MKDDKNKYNKAPEKSGSKGKTGYNKKRPYNKDSEDRRKGRENDSRTKDALKRRDWDDIVDNPINFWNKVTDLYDQATEVPFARILGDVYNVGGSGSNVVNYTIPGVLTIDFVPTVGNGGQYNDALNRAFDKLYAYIYERYTGAIQFQKNEVAMQVLSLACVAFLIGHVKRGLKTLMSYSDINHNLPRLLWEAEGFDPAIFDTEVQNLPNLRERTNNTVLAYNALAMPDFTDIFARWYALVNNVYCDDRTVDSQMTLFRPAGYYVFEEAHEESGVAIPSALRYRSIPLTLNSIASYLNCIDTLIQSIRNSSFFNLVNGALLRTFPTQRVQIEATTFGEMLSPVYAENINMQIQNAIVNEWTGEELATYTGTCSYDIEHDPVTDIIKCQPIVQNAAIKQTGHLNGWFLNLYDGVVDKEHIMEATRLMPFPEIGPDYDESDTTLTCNLVCGTEVPVRMTVYTYDRAALSGAQSVASYNGWTEMQIIVANSAGTLVQQPTNTYMFTMLVSHFRFHPTLYWNFIGYGGTPAAQKFKHIIGDTYKQTFITHDGLANLHNAAKLSIFDIKSLG